MNHSNEHEGHTALSVNPDKDDVVQITRLSARIVDATKKKWEKLLLSVSFWNKISVIACIIAVSTDPLFLYIAFLDRYHTCFGIDKALRRRVLITRALTDITFIFRIIYQLREAVKAVTSVSKSKQPTQRSNSKLFYWFESAMAVAKKLSWSSFVTDILAIVPIPHVLILAVFYAPDYGFSFTEMTFGSVFSEMTLNYLLLAQYVPRMYRIFISSELTRKNSTMWAKAAFYFFMYILSSHVIGAFYYFTTIQIQRVCWNNALRGRSGLDTDFRCDRNPPLSNISHHRILEECVNVPLHTTIYSMESARQTGPFLGLHAKLFYFVWWGLKNLSNYGTDINPSRLIWQNGFAILVSGIGLVLFALLIGNMQQCLQSSEDRKLAADKVQMKEQELQEWMSKYGVSEKLGKDAKKLGIEIMKKIMDNLKDDQNAEVTNLFSLLPWNTVPDLKFSICMSMLKKVRSLENMDEKGLRLICQYLKPVTYTEKTIVFRMGEPLDSMLFIMEGILLIYPTSTTTATSTDDHEGAKADIGYNRLRIRCSLENGDIYGDEQLLSWASSADTPDISYADLPLLTENVKCLSVVEGFVLTADDLKGVVSVYKLQGNYNTPNHLVVEVERSMTSISRGPSTVRRNRIYPSPRPGAEGARG